MNKMLSLIAFCTCFLAFSAWGISTLGRAQTRLPFFERLDLCQARPCYYGIVPGRTSWETADNILQQLPGMRLESKSDLGKNYLGPEGEIRLDRNAVDGPVTRIQVTPPEQSQNPVGVFLVQLGTPCGIMPDFLLERMKIFYPGASAIVQPASAREVRHPRPTSPIYSISLYDMGTNPPCAGVDRSIAIWLGFRPY